MLNIKTPLRSELVIPLLLNSESLKSKDSTSGSTLNRAYDFFNSMAPKRNNESDFLDMKNDEVRIDIP